MMSSQRNDITIKYESPYAVGLVPLPTPTPEPLKRLRTPEDSPDSAEKRQKIETATDAERRDTMNNLAAIVAKATAQQVTRGASLPPNPPRKASDAAEQIHQAQSYTAINPIHPRYGMQVLSLPMLESLSMQLLSVLAHRPYREMIQIVSDKDCELGGIYVALKSLFDRVKLIYDDHHTFLSPKSLDMNEKATATFRFANLATFVSNIFTGVNIDFTSINSHFVEIFTRDGEAMSKNTGSLYINLKTQMYLAGMSQEEPEKTKEETLEDLFPRHLEGMLAKRHGGSLLAEEISFLETARERYEYLMNAPSDAETIQSLSEYFSWEAFLSELCDHFNRTGGSQIALHLARHSVPQDTFNLRPKESPAVGNSKYDDIAKRAADDALQAVYGIKPHDPAAFTGFNSPYNKASVPYPTQSAPTQVLYEQARQAAVAKTNPGVSRRPGLPSQRRPWSTEEENALMAGLDQVKGPHWSQILALYGNKGSISEILRDRNQVQLKDKARNLKLFFLKSNIEVPYYLQSVTGELKTRAPSLAARQEAEDRAKMAEDDAQTQYSGMMALHNGFEDGISEIPDANESMSSPHEGESLDILEGIDRESSSVLELKPQSGLELAALASKHVLEQA